MVLNRRHEALAQAKIAMDLKADPDYKKLVDELQGTQ
jgi:hypothetical protein